MIYSRSNTQDFVRLRKRDMDNGMEAPEHYFLVTLLESTKDPTPQK